jgi:hypothetical protein
MDGAPAPQSTRPGPERLPHGAVRPRDQISGSAAAGLLFDYSRAFVLEPAGHNGTRLLVRTRIRMRSLSCGGSWAWSAAVRVPMARQRCRDRGPAAPARRSTPQVTRPRYGGVAPQRSKERHAQRLRSCRRRRRRHVPTRRTTAAASWSAAATPLRLPATRRWVEVVPADQHGAAVRVVHGPRCRTCPAVRGHDRQGLHTQFQSRPNQPVPPFGPPAAASGRPRRTAG